MDFDQLIKQKIAQRIEKLFPSSFKSPTIHIGTNILSGKQLRFPIEDDEKGLSSTHTYIPGSSGVGKSKLVEGISRDIIQPGYALIVLDGKGDLYDNLVDFCALLDFHGRPLAEKTILIDPNDDSYSVGINYLELLGKATPSALANLVLEALLKFFKEDEEYKPWLEEWLPTALVPLIQSKLTLLDLFPFLRSQEPEFREAILQELNEKFFKDKWNDLEKDFKPFEQARMLNVVRTRASYFWQDPSLKAIFGQEKTTIDWLKVMNEGGIVLAKLGRTEKLSEKTASLIGAAILHQVTTIAPSRPQGQRRPCFFVIDEFQKFATADFADALERMRGYGIHFILAHQHRDQVEEEILNAIDSCCRNKIVFAVSRKDAEDTAIQIFSGLIHKGAQEIKDEIWQTKYRPIKTYEEITSHHEADLSTETDVASSGFSQMSLPNEDFITLFPPEAVTETRTSVGAKGSGGGHTSGTSTVRAPWYDYEEYQELTSHTFHSLEEVKERFIAWVHNQDDRHAQWKFKSNKPIPIITPWVKPVIITDSIRQRFKEKTNAGHARPTAEVVQELEGRVTQFLKRTKQERLQKPTEKPIEIKTTDTKAKLPDVWE